MHYCNIACMHWIALDIASLASISINLLHAFMYYYDLIINVNIIIILREKSVWDLTLETELWLLLMMVPCIRSGVDPGEFLLNLVDGARTEIRLLLAVISLTDGALGLCILLICSTPHDSLSLSSQTWRIQPVPSDCEVRSENMNQLMTRGEQASEVTKQFSCWQPEPFLAYSSSASSQHLSRLGPSH